MYVPAHFQQKELAAIKGFLRDHDFATLVTWDGARPIATHLLLELLELPDGSFALEGHMARANPQWRSFSAEREALAIFHGPHTYISPTWYSAPAVPTWNYQAIHVYGQARMIDERDEVLPLLTRLVRRHEPQAAGGYDLAALPAELLESLLRGVAAFRIDVTKIDAGFKLSQNRKAGDYDNIIEQLYRRTDDDSHSIAEAMTRHRPKPEG